MVRNVPQKRGGLLGTGTKGVGGGGEERASGSTAHSDPEDRGGRGPPPEQQWGPGPVCMEKGFGTLPVNPTQGGSYRGG